MLKEPLLDRPLDEDVQPLFQMDELQSVSTSNVDGRLVHCQGTDGPTDLVHLLKIVVQHNFVKTSSPSWLQHP